MSQAVQPSLSHYLRVNIGIFLEQSANEDLDPMYDSTM